MRSQYKREWTHPKYKPLVTIKLPSHIILPERWCFVETDKNRIWVDGQEQILFYSCDGHFCGDFDEWDGVG